MASGLVAYLAIAAKIVPVIIVQQPWPTPVGLGGYLATTSWQGGLVSIICAIVAFLIWYPFIKHFDNVTLKNEKSNATPDAA